MRKKVLIYPSNAYVAEQVYFCLKDSLRYEPILANHGRAHAGFITKVDEDFPLITDPDFLRFINEYIKKNNISFIIPTHDTVALYLEEIQEHLNARVVCSDKETAFICRHKRETYRLFEDQEFVPKVYEEKNKIVYPAFVKDDVGQGGKRSAIVNGPQELDEFLNIYKDVDYILTEYLPGEEITVDCFTDRHHKLLFWQPRLRKSILTGMSGEATLYPKTDEIELIVRTINERMNFRGYWYCQCKKSITGNFKLMEISCRFAGTFDLTKNLDVNLPLLSLTDFDDIDVKIVPNNYSIESSRGYQNFYRIDYSYNRVYIDFDDTIVYRREKYIVATIAFLFQCLNKDIKITLLTRHAYDIRETMERLFLDTKIFDKIIEVEDGKRKSDYIFQKEQAIFIDNSFAERLDVKEQIGIPTFDVCNLECLIDL